MFRLWRSCYLIGRLKGFEEIGHLHEAHLNEEAFIACFFITEFVVGRNFKVFYQQGHSARGCLLSELEFLLFAHFKELNGNGVERHEKVVRKCWPSKPRSIIS